MWKWKTIALDYDGTLVEDSKLEIIDAKIIEGADIFTNKLKEEGWEVNIFTCRPSRQRKAIETNLRKQGVHFEHISIYGKPDAELYVYNKGLRFEGKWSDIYQWIKEKEK